MRWHLRLSLACRNAASPRPDALRLNAECPTALYARSILLTDAGRTDDAELLLGAMLAGRGLPEGTSLRDFAQKLRARFGTIQA